MINGSLQLFDIEVTPLYLLANRSNKQFRYGLPVDLPSGQAYTTIVITPFMG